MDMYRLPTILMGAVRGNRGQILGRDTRLTGCRAWGDTAAQALENLQSVAAAFIQSYRDRGDPLPRK